MSEPNIQQTDSGHDSLASDESSPMPIITPSPQLPAMDVIYSTVRNQPQLRIVTQDQPRTRKSITDTNKNNNHIYEDIDKYRQPPPNITPVSGVPNLKDKPGVIRPIAFRPTPVKRDSEDMGPYNTISNKTNQELHPSTGPTVFSPAGGNDGFAPGHPLIKDGGRHYGSSQDLNRPTPPAYNKFSSLDRRALARRHQPQGSNPLKLTAFSPSEPQQPPIDVKPLPPASRPGKEPERRHSSYNPASSCRLTRTPSQNSEYRLRGDKPRQFGNVNAVTVSSMNVNGLPDPFMSLRNNPATMLPTSGRSSLPQEARTRHSGAGTPQFRNLAGHQFPVRSTRGSLTNLNNLPGYKSLNRTNSGTNIHDDADNGSEEYGTPSPSDSAVGDLETILKEKDSEIVYLRETMEQNEQVIFKVYEEKEKMWERELRKIKGLYENRIKGNQQKSSKMESALMNQVFQLQNEKRKLEQEISEQNEMKNSQMRNNQSLQNELTTLRKHLEETEWTSCEKSGEISLLKSQVEDVAGSKKDSDTDVINLRIELNELKMELERTKQLAEDLLMSKKSMIGEVAELRNALDGAGEEYSLREISAQKAIIIERDKEIERLSKELDSIIIDCEKVKEEADAHKEHFEIETANWLCEKEKVIRYQKQLQLNYVSMYKKNKTLESEIDQLKKDLVEAQTSQKPSSHVSSAKARLFSRFSSKFSESQC